MQLRNGKTTEKKSNMALEKPLLTRNPKIYAQINIIPANDMADKKAQITECYKNLLVKKFIGELRAMMDEVNEWHVKTARIAGIIDIYDYILRNGSKLIDHPTMERFFTVVRTKIPEHLGELVELAFTYANDDETMTNIKKAKNNILSVSYIIK
jgi:hypothetical protein